MKNNYDRYLRTNEKKYNKKVSLSNLLMRKPGDKVIIPYICKIQKKYILEVGCGYGYYTEIMMEHNEVEGADINSKMAERLGIRIYQSAADNIYEKIKNKYDYIVSFWMTEYLSPKELQEFIYQSTKMLKKDGSFATTIILNRGIGLLYTVFARLKGIKKYSYSKNTVLNLLSNIEGKVSVMRINSICGIPFAILLEVKNEKK